MNEERSSDELAALVGEHLSAKLTTRQSLEKVDLFVELPSGYARLAAMTLREASTRDPEFDIWGNFGPAMKAANKEAVRAFCGHIAEM